MNSENSVLKRLYLSVLIFAVCLICLAFSGCSDGKTTNDGATTSSDTPQTTVSETETGEERLYPSLPDVTYEGYEFWFDQWEISGWNMAQDLFAEATDETKLGSAVYKRNVDIEDKYDISINVLNDSYDRIMQTYQNQVAAGDQDIDVFFVRSHEMQFIVTYYVCLDLYQLPKCGFAQAWWDQNSVEQLSIGHKLFMVESDITLRDKSATTCIYFNKDVQDDYRVGEIYPYVASNEWTWDKMISLAKMATHENGDSVWDQNDVWGLVALDDLTYLLLHGGGGRYATKDEDDLPIASFDEPRNLEVAQAAIDILYNDTYFFHLSKYSDTNNIGSMFTDGHALFYADTLVRAQDFRDMNTDFGIMPVPKYDENQESYGHSVSIHFSSAMSVPKTSEDISRTSVILEALAANSKYTVIPEYYNVVLKERDTRDEESKENLDLIFNTRVYDMGEFFQFGGFNTAYLRIWSYQSGSNVSTLYAQYKSKIEVAIKNFTEDVLGE